MVTAKRGRPVTGKAMTPAQRQQASRAKRLEDRLGKFAARQISILLSAQAIQALDTLANNRDKSQKEVIEELLIQAFEMERHAKTIKHKGDKSRIINKDKPMSNKIVDATPPPTSQFTLEF